MVIGGKKKGSIPAHHNIYTCINYILTRVGGYLIFSQNGKEMNDMCVN